MSEWYCLDENKNCIPCDTTATTKEKDRRIGDETINGWRISTVFLGLNHQFNPNRDPLLFETMIFKGKDYTEHYCNRYSTYQQALDGHNDVVQKVKDGLLPEGEKVNA